MTRKLLLFLWITGIMFSFARGQDELQRLTVFFTNDLHGGIIPQKAEFLNPEFPPILGGGASAAAIIGKIRAQGEEEGFSTLLIDGGDIFQGTLVGTLSRGMAIVEYMNLIKYDAVVPGNHDFDLGKDNLIELIKASHFPWVSANIYDETTGEPWKWINPWIITEKSGYRIGITGASTTGTESMSFAENVRGLDFRNEILSLQQAVNSLRDQNVDLIVALVHTGLPYDPREGYRDLKDQTYESVIDSRYVNAMEIAHFVKGIDVLLGGHLHKGYQQAWEDPLNHTICLQNYGNGGNLGWVDLSIDRSTRSIAGYDYAADNNSLLLLQQDQFWPDSAVAAFIEEQQKIYEKGFRDVVIGEAARSLKRSSIGEAPMNNLICDALRLRVNADFAFLNFGGIRADLPAGPITREDIFKVLPFGNGIVTFQADGRYLKEIVEQKISGNSRGLAISGGKIIYSKNYTNGQRVVLMQIGDEMLDPDKTYRVATNDYLMEGNSGLAMLNKIPRTRVAFTGILLREAVIEYVQRHSPLDIQTDGCWKRDDNAQPSPEWVKKFGEPQASNERKAP